MTNFAVFAHFVGRMDGGVEAVDRFHHVEGGTQNGRILASRHEGWVPDVCVSKRVQQARLPHHSAIAFGPKMYRSAPQHELTLPPCEPYQHVLGPARKLDRIPDRPVFHANRIHPFGQTGKVDAVRAEDLWSAV